MHYAIWCNLLLKAAGTEICQLIASDKSNLLGKVYFLSKLFLPSYSIFYSFGGRISDFNCRKLCLQMSTTITFWTLQNNFWLVYIFGKFLRLVVEFHYGHVALLFFQSRIPKLWLSSSKVVKTCKDKKGGKCASFKVIFRNIWY